MTSSSDIIDLTNSFTLADHCCLSNIIIDLDTEDSICMQINSSTDSLLIGSGSATDTPILIQPAVPTSGTNLKKKILKKNSNCLRKSDVPHRIEVETSRKNNFGGCPICWDDLGTNPLASTKCGHVYCMKCLQEYLKVEKRCPTCRKGLKGSTAYHPLYLS